jgi:signal transduction histidine kinase
LELSTERDENRRLNDILRKKGLKHEDVLIGCNIAQVATINNYRSDIEIVLNRESDTKQASEIYQNLIDAVGRQLEQSMTSNGPTQIIRRWTKYTSDIPPSVVLGIDAYRAANASLRGGRDIDDRVRKTDHKDFQNIALMIRDAICESEFPKIKRWRHDIRQPLTALILIKNLLGNPENITEILNNINQSTADLDSQKLRQFFDYYKTNLPTLMRFGNEIGGQDGLAKEDVEAFNNGIERLTRMMAGFQREMAGNRKIMKRINVEDLFQDIRAFLRGLSRDVEFDYDIRQKCRIQADPSDIDCITGNLIHNSVQSFKPDNRSKRIILAADLLKNEEIKNRLEHIIRRNGKDNCFISLEPPAQGSVVQIVVTDSGCGIKPDDLHKIFEEGFSTKGEKENSGIGLSTVKKLISSYNGGLCVISNNNGTAFNIFLPATGDL